MTSTPAPIAFWFDFGSPYSWIAATQVADIAARCGRPLHWRAFLLGVLFRETGMAPLSEQRLRGAYAARDVARLARWHELPFATAVAPPGCSLALARVFHALDLASPSLAARFAAAAMTATFGHGAVLADLPAAQVFAARLGPEAAAAAAGAMAPPAREALRATTQAAAQGGIFGAPFFVADGEPFWGQDRLPMLEAWLREGGWSSRGKVS
ncbi:MULTISPECIES: 2-hydroxychromene-2-carboxylate isomerase [Roseomonadaceae]|uniref:2-hydroxychromene-2-carboxylate isomerase n=1 Tax=Falsiroseomonas oleicola TaxID=2801474 RepID=A0ABS6HBV9_9PROT|nr:DsbA family protein [Roseomonas oleicola]MBU8546204.1 DsbA family protein [Roseomonas oleicola]